MANYNIIIKNKFGKIISEKSEDDQCSLVYKDAYLHDDTITFESSDCGIYVVVSVDDAMESSFVSMKSLLMKKRFRIHQNLLQGIYI